MKLPIPQDFNDWKIWARELVRRLELSNSVAELAKRLAAGSGVTLTYDGQKQVITLATSGGGGLEIRDEGASITGAAGFLDFVGDGVEATTVAGGVQVSIPAPAQFVTLATDFTTTATTMTDITGLALAIGANEVWWIEVMGHAESTGSGVGISLGAPAGAEFFGRAWIRYAGAGGTSFYEARVSSAVGLDYTSGSLETYDQRVPAGLSVVVRNGATAGNAQVKLQSGSGSATATLRAGAVLRGMRVA